MSKVGAQILGVALNRLSPTNTDGYYYYYYHHYYGDGEKGDGDKKTRNSNGTGGSGEGATPTQERVRRNGGWSLRSAARRLTAIFPSNRSQ